MDEISDIDSSQEMNGVESNREISGIDIDSLANANPRPNSRQVAQAVSEIQDPRTRHTIQEFLSINATSKPQAYGPDALIDRMPDEQCLEAFQTIMGIPRYKIETEAADRQKERESEERKGLREMIFLGGLIILILVVGGIALFAGHAEIAQNVFTGFGGLIAGGLGGYGYGRRKE